jgi:hypothetical protein
VVRAIAVENEFRQLLGIQHREDHRELPPQVDDDLMWIPTPEAIDPIKRRKPREEGREESEPEEIGS